MKRLFALVLLFSMLSCEKSYESLIPFAAVRLELDIYFQDKVLSPIMGYKIYTQENVDQAGELTGYGGVLVYHAVDDQYYAFDVACPHEVKRDTKVHVDSDGLYAVCDKCGSKFDLAYGIGNPVSGPSQYALQCYTVMMNGYKIIVTN